MLNVKSFSLVGFIKKPYVNVSSNLVSLRDLEIDSQPREVSETHTAEQYISCYVKNTISDDITLLLIPSVVLSKKVFVID